MNLLSVENISKRFGERLLFENVSFGLQKGQKTALIAKNGSGKSTLLRILNSEFLPDSGQVVFRNDITVSFLTQTPTLTPTATIEEVIFEESNPATVALKNYEAAVMKDDAKAMQMALDEIERVKAWEYEANVKQLLAKLNITKLHSTINQLSGGQQKRVALAMVLLQQPDVLIMDEPTNHLDLEMIEWLENYLSASSLTLLMVTHDRYFLDSVCDNIIELDQETIFTYKGDYKYYLEKRAERKEQQLAEKEKAQNHFKKELEWMRRQPKARTTKSKARIDAFYDVKKKAKVNLKEDELQLQVQSQRLGAKILEFHHVGKQFDDLKLIEDFNHKFVKYEKLGLIGRNGTGKSTLLKMIMGEEQPTTGKIIYGETIKIGYYSQDGMEFDPTKKVIEAITDIADHLPLAKGRSLSAAQLLERFLFPRWQQHQLIEKLSGGEKRRLYLLTILMQNPNFLILDEPTNDLDIVTLDVLEDFLADFQGCLLIVSHDRYFMDRLVEHIIVLEGEGKWRNFPGNYTMYRHSDVFKNKSETIQKAVEEKPKQEKKAPDTQKVKLSYKEKREFEQLEIDIDALETEKDKLTEELNSGNLDHVGLQEKAQKLEEVIAALEEKEMRWLELSEKI